MERSPIEDQIELHTVITGVYNLLFEDEIHPETIRLYAIDSEHVEAEIDLPYIGINRDQWANEWAVERKLEVLLHEFAHIEEGPDEYDHGPRFYERLTTFAEIALEHKESLEAVFDASIDYGRVREHIVDSVNEYTVENEIETVEARQNTLRDSLALSNDTGAADSAK